MAENVAYILVYTSTDAFDLHKRLRQAHIAARIAPVPRGINACCGASIRLSINDVQAARELIEKTSFSIEGIVEVENTIDPHRDRFC